MKTSFGKAIACSAAVILAAITPSNGSAQATVATPTEPGRETVVRDTVPIGAGTLKQDEVTVAIRTGALLLKVTPLNEQVIRLLAPDTYRRLHALAQSRREEATRGMGERELFLVSFFSYEPDVTFQPEDVQLTHQGRTLRPEAIIAITPGWGRQRMQQQQTETAVYAFEAPINFQQDITLRYGFEESDTWRAIITRLENERVKVKARAGN